LRRDRLFFANIDGDDAQTRDKVTDLSDDEWFADLAWLSGLSTSSFDLPPLLA